MSNELLSNDLLFKIKFILSNAEKDVIIHLEDLSYWLGDKLYIKSDDAVLFFGKTEDTFIFTLFSSKDSIDVFKSLKLDINQFKFLILKNKSGYTFCGNENLLKECVIPMVHSLFYDLLESKDLTEKDIYSEKIFSVDYQINLLNQLFNLTREQALLSLFSSPSVNGLTLANLIMDCGDISYKVPEEVYEDYDVYVFKNNYKDQDDGSYKVDSLNQEWYNASQELLNLINTNHPLIKFREQDESNIIQFKEWLQHLKVA